MKTTYTEVKPNMKCRIKKSNKIIINTLSRDNKQTNKNKQNLYLLEHSFKFYVQGVEPIYKIEK